MNYEVISIKDRATGLFSRPWFTRTHAEAVRIFTDEVNREGADNPINKHPDDYTLYAIAVWNDNTGSFQPHEPRKLCDATTILERHPNGLPKP